MASELQKPGAEYANWKAPDTNAKKSAMEIGGTHHGELTQGRVGDKKVSAADKGQEPVERDEEMPSDAVGKETSENIAEEFDALKQYEKLRLVLEQEVKKSQSVRTFIDTYSSNVLKSTLNNALRSSPRNRDLAGAIMFEFSDALQTKVDSGKSTDKKAANEAWKAVVGSGVFEQLKKIFNAAESFGTTDPNIALERFAAMSAKRNMMGRTSQRDNLLMALLSEARYDTGKTKEVGSTKA